MAMACVKLSEVFCVNFVAQKKRFENFLFDSEKFSPWKTGTPKLSMWKSEKQISLGTDFQERMKSVLIAKCAKNHGSCNNFVLMLYRK